MIPYWMLLLVWAGGAVQYQRHPERMGGSAGFWLAIMITALFVGLRWQVGGDWGNYQRQFDNIAILTAHQSLAYTDPAYGLLNWVVARLGMNVVAVNMTCAAIFMWGVGSFAARQVNPWLVVVIGVPYFIIVVGMGYTRQATAIGLVLVGLSIADRRSVLTVVLCVGAGALFHKSAVLALPLIAASLMRRNLLFLIAGLAGSAGLYVWVLGGATDRFVGSYVNSTYQSSGAAIRVAMNVLAGSMFFLNRKRMRFNQTEESYWFVSSILSFLCIFGLIRFSSSVGVDRLALFLIPLQLAIYSRLPYADKHREGASSGIILGIIVYSAVVLYSFLGLGQNSKYWLPYDAAPFVIGQR